VTRYTAPLRDGYVLNMDVAQQSQDIGSNSSRVRLWGYITRPSNQADNTAYQTVWSTSINGVTDNGTTAGYDFSGYSILTLVNQTYTIVHDADGTKSFTVALAWRETDPDPQVGYTTATQISRTFTLTTIPRASDPSFSASAVDAGDPITINTNRASSSFTHTVKYSIGSASGTIATGVGASTSWTPPLSLLAQIPNSTSGTMTITLDTYSGSTKIGTKSSTFTLRVPSSVVPDFTTISHSEAVASVASQVGAYVKGQTKLTLTVGGEAGAYGSTITARKITVAGQTINADSGTTPSPINASGTVTVTATVTDSRGRTRTKSITVTVLNWSAPVITTAKLQRALSNGALNDEGTTIRLDLTSAVSSLVNGTQKNSLKYKIYTRLRGAATWTLAVAEVTAAGISTSALMVLASTYAITSAWEVRVEVRDIFTTTAVQGTVSTSKILMHLDAGVGIGINKYREAGALDIGGDAYVSGKLRLTSTADVSPSSTGHPFQIGLDSGLNVAIDNNQIQFRDNAAAATAAINTEGGNVSLGDASSTITIPGNVNAAKLPYAEAAGSVAGITLAPAAETVTAVTFPSGRFNVAPRVVVGQVGGYRDTSAWAANVTATGFDLVRGSTSVASRSGVGANWEAKQMTSSAASG